MAVSAKVPAKGSPALPVELPPGELTRRVAILKRFRELLQAQRDRFRDYLAVLDTQKDVIAEGETGDFHTHVELEEKILADIFAIQKVIDPLDVMYRSVYSETAGDRVAPVSEVVSLKNALEDLKAEAKARTERNKALLASRMDEIRKEIKTIKKNPYRSVHPVYSGEGTASLVDIRT
ncbi:MAG: flagellar biosynthesis protein FlgN [Treponema sp.]|jgi:hypothetical protein|nr:flagellar biosynthesis protein FlgN [Treponema sp.]